MSVFSWDNLDIDNFYHQDAKTAFVKLLDQYSQRRVAKFNNVTDKYTGAYVISALDIMAVAVGEPNRHVRIQYISRFADGTSRESISHDTIPFQSLMKVYKFLIDFGTAARYASHVLSNDEMAELFPDIYNA